MTYSPATKRNICLHLARSCIEWMINVVCNIGSKEPIVATISEQVANWHCSVRETVDKQGL